MPRNYQKVEQLSQIVFQRKAAGETNREIAESYGLTKVQIKGLLNRQNRKARLVTNGYIPQKKGRPSKGSQSEFARKENEIVELQMKVDILRNFLLEIGRK